MSIKDQAIPKVPEIIAHRGASYDAPENTIASVKLGYVQGADAVEIDIHLSKDNRLMVIHDKNTKRTAGGVALEVRETNSEELRKLEVGSWKDSKFTGEKIPFLEEVLPLVPKGRRLFVEIKVGPEILPYLKKALQQYKNQNRVVIISFNKESIVEFKALFPNIPAYWLLGNFNEHSLENAIEFAIANKLNGLNVHFQLATLEMIQKMNRAGLEVYTYTVNDVETANTLTSYQIKGITTDRPEWLRGELSTR